LTDRHGRTLRDLRIAVTDRCNFRCPYCMPEEQFGDRYHFLPKDRILSFEEVTRIARAFVALGVRKLRITGGEPLLRADLPRLVAQLAAIDGVEDLSLTTNGYLLAGFATELAQAGLRRVTISLDSLDEATFKAMSGRRYGPGPVLAGLDAAVRAGLAPVKVNCVVKRGVNDRTIVDLADRFRGTGVIVRFIEYMDVGNLNRWEMRDVVPAREILAALRARFPLEPLDANYAGEVAERWRYVDGAGEIGVIASVTRPFCGGCTRARLAPEGNLVTCLFATGGVNLRDVLRAGIGDEQLLERIAAIWRSRTDRYSEERAGLPAPRSGKIEMFQLGG